MYEKGSFLYCLFLFYATLRLNHVTCVFVFELLIYHPSSAKNALHLFVKNNKYILFTQDFYGFWVTAKKIFWFRDSAEATVKEKNMNKIVPTTMDLNDYLLSFLTKRIRWEILLE